MFNKYINGNYNVYINDKDGTKIRISKEDKFIPDFPESMDIKITNKCNKGCKYCHEDSKPNGDHCDINQEFFNSFHPFQEVAIGGGNVLEHPQLESLLKKLRKQKVIPSITINQDHFIENFDYIKYLYENNLIFGIGVSLTDSTNKILIEKMNQLPTSVLHVINGIFSEEDVNNLKNKNLKILILGYKEIRRGEKYYLSNEDDLNKNMEFVKNNIHNIFKNFNIISFDNLALEQIPVKDFVSKEQWESRYMGDDGNFTFYIDAVKKEFAISSTSLNRSLINTKTIDQMFDEIKK